VFFYTGIREEVVCVGAHFELCEHLWDSRSMLLLELYHAWGQLVSWL
jgi:hypothetical protein